jgi:hypothetical protein
VNDPARSIVSRIKRRLSIACACNGMGSGGCCRMERTEAIKQ